MSTQADEGQTFLGEIYSFEGRFELEHASGRLILEVHYFDGTPAIIARLDLLSPEVEKRVRHYAFQLRDLPLLFSHAAQILRERVVVKEPKNHDQAPTVCRVK